jgi:hypothetical protein
MKRTVTTQIRISREAFLGGFSGRLNPLAKVIASAARRVGTTLQRIAEMADAAAPAPVGPSYLDLLLTKLVDHEIDSMRAAEVRGDSISFDDVVEFYGSTRFLYPAKLGVLESRFDAIRATWERLLDANNDVFKILMLRRVTGESLTVKNSICAFEYATGTWQVQHLVSADRHERSGTLASLIGMTDWLHGHPDVGAVRLTYRPDNPGANQLFGGLADVLATEESTSSVCTYHIAETATDRIEAWNRDIDVAPLAASDLPGVEALYASVHPRLPRWLALCDPTSSRLTDRYAACGMERGRQIFVASKGGVVRGAVSCWWAAEGINFSFLENAIDGLVLDGSLSKHAKTEITAGLLSAAVRFYAARGRRHAVALIDATHSTYVEASGVLPPPEKRYATALFDHAQLPAAREHFMRHYSRVLCDETALSQSASHGGVG